MQDPSGYTEWNETPKARYLAYGKQYWPYLLRGIVVWGTSWVFFFGIFGVVVPFLAGNPRWRDHVDATVVIAMCIGVGSRTLGELLWRTVRVSSDGISIHALSWSYYRLADLSCIRFCLVAGEVVRLEFEAKMKWGRVRRCVIGVPRDMAASVSASLPAGKLAVLGQEEHQAAASMENLSAPSTFEYSARRPAAGQRLAFAIGIPLLSIAICLLVAALVLDLRAGVSFTSKIIAVPLFVGLMFAAAGLLCLHRGVPWLLDEYRRRRRSGTGVRRRK
ncbi:MAG TPA: hypothetical protein VG269_15190 [Tepidisphaeraceae bacterium]|nr:hypothetical protein [Tepidisphaeraceae bacterium]